MKYAALPSAILLAACASHAAVQAAAPAAASPSAATGQMAAGASAVSNPASLPVCRHQTFSRCDARPPAYAGDVIPILKKRCFGCHTGDGVAADELDFSRIEALRGAATEIVDEVSTCAMPPKSRLDDHEADVLLHWVACGQPTD